MNPTDAYHKVMLAAPTTSGDCVLIEADALGRLKIAGSAGGGGGSTAITIVNTSSQPIPVIGAFAIAEPLSIDDNGGSLTVDGTVGISGTVPVSGPLTDAQLRAGAVGVTDARLPAALDSDGGLKVHVQSPVPVTDNGGSVTVDGVVALDAATLAALEAITVANFPAAQPVTDNGGSLTVDGIVAVGNFPAVQPIREVPNVTTWVSAKTAAPTANSVQADTGALAAGDYDFFVNLTAADTIAVGKGLVIEHRNAANAATLFNLGAVTAGESNRLEFRRYTIATNERIRVIAGTAAGAASSMYVSAIGRRLT